MPVRHATIQIGTSVIQASLDYRGERIWITSPYHKGFIQEIRAMEGAKWHGYDEEPVKKWSIANTERNEFALAYLEQKRPYARFRRKLDDIQLLVRPNLPFPPRQFQLTLAKHMLRGWGDITAGDPGVGKSLASIIAVETFFGLIHKDVKPNREMFWYVGPKAGVVAYDLELRKWNSHLVPRLLTYEQVVQVLATWRNGDTPPRVVIFDECHKIKTHSVQRSKAAKHLVEAIRKAFPPDNSFTPPYLIIEMSGTVTPKDPTDLWHQCEVACPGYIREGHPMKLKARLSLLKNMEGLGGVSYPKVITWFDDEKKCKVCGGMADDYVHTPANQVAESYHPYEKSNNEVAAFGARLEGLVYVLRKTDCMDLPDKVYEPMRLKPTIEMVRASKLIIASAPRAIQALTLLRELSDGFQYTEKVVGSEVCDGCKGTRKIYIRNAEGEPPTEYACPACDTDGRVPVYERAADGFPTPKDAAYQDDLDAMEEHGRLVTWGAFTATIDKLVAVSQQSGWYTLRVDGRGFCGFKPDGSVCDHMELLAAMDRSSPQRKALESKYPRVSFVGQPQSGGMALTLTASPMAIYYSNVFSGGDRMQSEDRIHRLGMDENRSPVIKDYICLGCDQLVLDNLNNKRWLQDLTLGDLREAIERNG